MAAAFLDRGVLCKELEQIDKAAARDAYAISCKKKKLRCEDAKRLGK